MNATKRVRFTTLVIGGMAATIVSAAGPAAASPDIQLPERMTDHIWHTTVDHAEGASTPPLLRVTTEVHQDHVISTAHGMTTN